MATPSQPLSLGHRLDCFSRVEGKGRLDRVRHEPPFLKNRASVALTQDTLAIYTMTTAGLGRDNYDQPLDGQLLRAMQDPGTSCDKVPRQ